MPAIAEVSAADWHRLNRLLEQALAIDDGQARERWLQALPAEQAEQAELLPLLRRLLGAEGLIETGAFAALPPLEEPAPAAGERAGDSLGPYRLVRELGAGGMGTVWLAERADGAFDRAVALKLPRAEWTDRGLAQRFARERSVLAALNHPHIAQLFDAGWSASGRPYLALEYVDGLPIHAWCEQHELDIRARLALFVTVIRAVAHAHARLVVHRDLKPSNVLVARDGQVKLLDFGIAKLLADDGSAAEETELTRLGGRALTPQYAAPEQILGKPVSTSADLYALGVLLFELLTGKRPYRLDREALQRRGALEDAILHVDAPAPSAVVKDSTVRRALRGDLDAIVLKALAKQPEARYETAAAFADDIERHLARLPVRAQRAGRLYRLGRFIARNRLAVGAGSVVMLALLVGLSLALWQASVAREQAARANLIKDFVLSIIQQADPVASRRTREADAALLSTAEGRVDQELARHPELALQMRRAIAAAYRNRGDYERTAAVLRKGIEQARGVLPADHIELLQAFVQIADMRVIDTRKAKVDLEHAIVVLRRLGPEHRTLLADALYARHVSMSWSAVWQDLVAAGHEALEAAKATGDPGRILFVAAEVTGMFNYLGHDRPGTLALITQAYDEAMRSGRIEPSDPRRLNALSRRATASCFAGNKEEGLTLAQQALDEARRFHGADSHSADIAHFELGSTFRCIGNTKKASESFRAAYDITLARESPQSENRSVRRAFLVSSLLALERHDEVRQLLKETPAARPIPGAPADSPGATPVHHHIEEANIHLQLGETEVAERLAEESLAVMVAEKAEITAGKVYSVLAQALYQNGKFERAEWALHEAMKPRGEWTPPRPGGRGWTLLMLSRVRLERNHPQGALEAVDQADARFAEGGRSPAAAANLDLLRGRALLALGRAREAAAAIAEAHAHVQKTKAGSEFAAVVSHWYGRALIAAGESARGRELVLAARPQLSASRFPRIRALADVPAKDG
jgi:serine/threonine-protein kinase